MKLAAVIICSLLMSATAVLVYDQLRESPDAGDAVAMSTSTAEEVDALSARLDALEGRGTPTLVGQRQDPDILAALRRLEERITALEAADSPGVSRDASDADAPAPKFDPNREPTEAELDWQARLNEGVRRRVTEAKRRARTHAALAKAQIELNPTEIARLDQVWQDFQVRRNEIWSEVKRDNADAEASAWPTLILETRTRIRDALAEEVRTVLPRQDAEGISRALLGGGDK